MTVRTQMTSMALRAAIRFAWGLAAVAKRLAALGERIEQWADKKATDEGVDPYEILWPLVAPVVARA